MTRSDNQDTLRVYCAGPLFNRSERSEMEEIADRLCDVGYRVYLPHRDGMEFRLIHAVLIQTGWEPATAAKFLHQAIFALDVFQLADECDAVVWNLNGRTPDEGAVSEAAIAWTLGKPMVAYSDDVRSLIAGRINPLLAGLVDFETIDEIDALPECLAKAIATQPASLAVASQLPAALQRAIDDGRKLWSAMASENGQDNDEHIAAVVAELFAPESNKAEVESSEAMRHPESV